MGAPPIATLSMTGGGIGAPPIATLSMTGGGIGAPPMATVLRIGDGIGAPPMATVLRIGDGIGAPPIDIAHEVFESPIDAKLFRSDTLASTTKRASKNVIVYLFIRLSSSVRLGLKRENPWRTSDVSAGWLLIMRCYARPLLSWHKPYACQVNFSEPTPSAVGGSNSIRAPSLISYLKHTRQLK